MKAYLIRDDFENGDCVNCPIEKCDCDEKDCPLRDVEIIRSAQSISKEACSFVLEDDYQDFIKKRLAGDLGEYMLKNNFTNTTILEDKASGTFTITVGAVVLRSQNSRFESTDS